LFLEYVDLFVEFFDSLVGRLQLALRGGKEVDQAISVNPPLTHILFELVESVHAGYASNSAFAQLRQFSEIFAYDNSHRKVAVVNNGYAGTAPISLDVALSSALSCSAVAIRSLDSGYATHIAL